MRVFFKILSYSSFFMPIMVFAALPPAAESLRRLKAIAESPAVYERLNSADQVISIGVAKEGYIVTTNRCRLFVSIKETNLKDIDPGLIGPAKLQVIPGEMNCQTNRKVIKRRSLQ